MLKEREQKILDYMKEEIREKGYPPTVREICSALHIKSTSTAHKDIDSLVKKLSLIHIYPRLLKLSLFSDLFFFSGSFL